MLLRPTTPDDLARVLALEADPEAAAFIIRWSEDEHRFAIAADDQAHIIFEQHGQITGFALLAGLLDRNQTVELRRIVVSPVGHGLGRAALSLLIDHAFNELAAHRLWLDVKVANERAQRAYQRAGFVREGVLRDALLTNGSFESLIVMSMLRQERPT